MALLGPGAALLAAAALYACAGPRPTEATLAPPAVGRRTHWRPAHAAAAGVVAALAAGVAAGAGPGT
jgi:hypothetical protein